MLSRVQAFRNPFQVLSGATASGLRKSLHAVAKYCCYESTEKLDVSRGSLGKASSRAKERHHRRTTVSFSMEGVGGTTAEQENVETTIELDRMDMLRLCCLC